MVEYVTFTMNAAIGTRITVGGVKIAVEPTQREGAYAALMYSQGAKASVGWLPLSHEVPLLPFDGVPMATLDVVTVKLDRAAGLWSIWFRDTLVGQDLPFAPTTLGASARFAIEAGEGGAWLCGLVCGDENPLFADTNRNDVPDDFEVASFGNLLGTYAAPAVVADLRTLWRDARRGQPPSEFIQTTPLPDSFPDWCEPDGAPVHGMADTFRYRQNAN